jgi:hypothetical protein
MALSLHLGARLKSRLRGSASGSVIDPESPAQPEGEWEVASVLAATPGGLFGASALRYDVFPSKEVAESEARSLEAVTGREVIVRTPAEAREAAQREQEDFDRRMQARMAADEDLFKGSRQPQ